MARVPGMAPGDLHEAVETAFNTRDVESLVALYEPDAWLFGVTGPVQGTEAIRAAWTEMLAMGGKTRLVTQYVIEQGDIALLSNRWTSVAGEDEISATSAEVARRQSDGTWKYVIDNPDSAGVLAG
jgi:ketosteroid isomerase-like protein